MTDPNDVRITFRKIVDAPHEESSLRDLESLIEAGSTLALVTVVMYYHLLTPSMRAIAITRAPRFAGVVPYLFRNANQKTRYNCLEFMGRCNSAVYASMIQACIKENDAQATNLALGVINNALEDLVASLGQPRQAEDATSLVAGRREIDALKRGSKENTEVESILAALRPALEKLSLHENPAVVDWLVRLGSRGDEALLALLKYSSDSSQNLLVRDLGQHPRLASICLIFSMLASASTQVRHLGVDLLERYTGKVEASHVAQMLNSLGDATCEMIRLNRCLPWLDQLKGNWTTIRGGLALKWVDAVSALEIDVSKKFDMLDALIDSGFDDVVRASLEAMRKHYTPLVRGKLIEYSRHPVESVKYHALRVLSDLPFEGRIDILKHHLDSVSTRIRSLATQGMANEHLELFVSRFDQLPEAQKRGMSRVFGQMKGSVLERVQPLLLNRDARERCRGLKILKYTGVPIEASELVLALTRDVDRHVRAYASALLGQLTTVESARVTLRLLKDDDLRVRANAIEAIEAFGLPDFQKALLPQLSERAPRIRANAAKAMYRLGSPLALQILNHMAQTAQGAPKLSSVWALANIKRPEAMRQAMEIAKFECDLALQRRMLRFIDDAEDDLREEKYGSRPLQRVAA